MKVTTHSISIPPYISTSWRNIHSIHMSEGILVITMADGEAVYVPNLVPTEIDLIFKAHQVYLDHEEKHQERDAQKSQANCASNQSEGNPLNALLQAFTNGGATAPIRVNLGSLENLGMLMQHNPQQAEAPNLPPDVLEKVASLAKMMSLDDLQAMPRAEPHCNCFHCQITRAIVGEEPKEAVYMETASSEPVVQEEDLRFQQWEVKETGESMYSVTNKLDPGEHYHVYLGHPMGCTCGKQGCEHIVAVLHS